jgi:hypothetical protein
MIEARGFDVLMEMEEGMETLLGRGMECCVGRILLACASTRGMIVLVATLRAYRKLSVRYNGKGFGAYKEACGLMRGK